MSAAIQLTGWKPENRPWTMTRSPSATIVRARIWGNHTRQKFKYGKEFSPCGLEYECSQKERSTSMAKQLVFQYRFCCKTSSNRILERFLLVE
jgi:hypothetical protein